MGRRRPLGEGVLVLLGLSEVPGHMRDDKPLEEALKRLKAEGEGLPGAQELRAA